MGFGEAISSCLSNYVTFSGRAPRSEYWYFVLFNFLVSIPAVFLDLLVFPNMNGIGPFRILVSLVLLLPGLAVSVRRLHDVDRSGYVLLGLYVWMVIVVGVAIGLSAASGGVGLTNITGSIVAVFGLTWFGYAIWIFILNVTRGTNGPNRYGEDTLWFAGRPTP